MPEELLTYREAWVYLKMSRQTFMRLLATGKLPVYYPMPKSPRIRVSDLQAYLEQTRQARAEGGEAGDINRQVGCKP